MQERLLCDDLILAWGERFPDSFHYRLKYPWFGKRCGMRAGHLLYRDAKSELLCFWMKERTDCNFAAMVRSIGGLAGIPLLPSRVFDSVKRSVRHVRDHNPDRLVKPPDGQLCYEGNLGSETRQRC
jgi:hypothetical protein